MQIKLITPELHEELTTLAEEHPELTLQNEGYEYLDNETRELHATQIVRIEEILKEHVVGFSRFFNFRHSKTGALTLRFNFNWGAEDNTRSFIGVGYLPLDVLRDGFPVTTAPLTENLTTV